jgi:hypothetical protein
MAELQMSSMADVTLATLPPTATDRPRAKTASKLLIQAGEQALGHSDFLDVLQVSRRGGLAVIRHEGALKVFKFIGCRADWKKRWARLIGWNPARRAVNMSRALTNAGISVCEVENFGNVSLPEAPRAVWTISRYVEGGRTLRQLKQELQPDRLSPAHPVIVQLFGQGLKLLRRIHDAGFEHRDYHAGNLLVTNRETPDSATLRLVDLETVMRRKATTVRRARDVRRYIENFVEPQDYAEVIKSGLELYAPGEAALQAAIRATRRLQGLIRKKGERWEDE